MKQTPNSVVYIQLIITLIATLLAILFLPRVAHSGNVAEEYYTRRKLEQRSAAQVSVSYASRATLPRETERATQSVTALPESPQVIAEAIVSEWWSPDEWSAFNEIIQRESGWNVNAKNPRSTAAGLGQLLASNQKKYGCYQTTEYRKQIMCAVRYIQDRFGNPSKAIAYWDSHGSY